MYVITNVRYYRGCQDLKNVISIIEIRLSKTQLSQRKSYERDTKEPRKPFIERTTPRSQEGLPGSYGLSSGLWP